jgi:hypothetical protein
LTYSKKEKPVPPWINFKTRFVHYDKQTYTLGDDFVTLTALKGKCVKAGVKAQLFVGETSAPFMLPEPIRKPNSFSARTNVI